MRLILPALLAFAASAFPAWGKPANLVPGVQFTHLTFSDGLPLGEVREILQDRQGYLWFGTDEGLSRYDGYELRNFDVSSVSALLEDQTGEIRAGTESGGLLQVNPRTGGYRPIVIRRPQSESGGIHGKINSLLKGDDPGQILVGHQGGLSSFNQLTLAASPMAKFEGRGVNVVFRDSANRLWAGTDSGDLMLQNSATGEFAPFWTGGAPIRDLCEDREGNLWLATTGRGVIRLKNENGKAELLPFDEAAEMKFRNATSVLQDSQDKLWIGSPDGLIQFDPATDVFVQYRHDPLESGSLLSNQISFLFEDRSNVLWIGFTTGGVSRFSVDRDWFPRVSGLSHRSVWSLGEGRDGEFWIGTGNGLNRWNPETGTSSQVAITLGHSGETLSEQITVIHEDRRNRVWLGTAEGKLVRSTDGENFEDVSPFRHDPDRVGLRSHDIVTDIVEDRDGGIWVGTAGGGIALYIEETGTFKEIPIQGDGSLNDKFISDLHSDDLGVIRAGTRYGGLLRYHPGEGVFVKDGHFKGSEITVIFGGSEEKLWIGRAGGGLSCLDLSSGELLTLSRRNSELPDDDIMGIVGDDLGYLWIGTRSGLARLDPQSFDFRIFDEFDGLQSRIFHPRVTLKGSDGRLLFGGPNGLNVIDPRNLPQPHKPSRVILTGLELFGEPVFPSKDGILKEPLAVTDVLRIPYTDHNRISLRFGTLDYATPLRSFFRFRMEGADETWQMADHSRRATYIGLQPGRYSFQVEASPDGKTWSPDRARLKVEIQPPWWALWYVRVLIVITVIGLIGFLIFLRFRDRERKMHRERQELEIKYSKAEAGLARQLQHAMLLEETGLAIGTSGETGTLLDTALRHLGEAYGVSRCYVRVPALNAAEGSPAAVAEYHESDRGSFSHADTESELFTDAVRNSDQPIAINEVSEHPDLFPDADRLQAHGIRSMLAVRISCLGDIKGILVLQQCQTARVWQPDEIKLLESLAAQFGMVLAQIEQQEKDECHRSELEKARQSADSANNSKSDFLAKMTHELRTPLNAIIGFSELLGKETDLPPTQRETVDIINHSGEHLLEIINDILEISKIEAGKVDLTVERFNLANLLKSVYEMLAFGVRSKGLRFEITKLGKLPSMIEADKAKIRQVLINLISNSTKFTEAGSITLQVRSGGFSAPDGTMDLYFEVHDTGPGIAKDELPLIFDNFSQSETGVKSRNGTGLGLAISKTFVELMGGGIEVESEIGVGTTFRFRIPCREIAGVQAAHGEDQLSNEAVPRLKRLAPGQPDVRILIAEDQPANRLLVKRILLSAGFVIEEAENGAEAVEKWRSFHPDLILMDEEMPIMRGAEAVRLIRSEGGDDPSPVIISLTAFALDEARAAALKSGCDDFLAKPFKSDVLMQLIAKHLSIQFDSGVGQSSSNAA